MAQKTYYDLIPLYDRVLVKRVEAIKVSEGGIIIPEATQEKPLEGTVVSVGEGRRTDTSNIPLIVMEGDRVLFGRYAGTEIRVNDEEHVILREDEILGIMRERVEAKSGRKRK